MLIWNELLGSVLQALLFALAPFLVWVFTARKNESFFPWIGLKKPVFREGGKTLLITLGAALLYMGGMTLCIRFLPAGITTAGSQYQGQGPAALPAVLLQAFLRTALSEEILFRGFILKRIQKRAGFMLGNTAQALLFGLMHGVPFALATKSLAAFLLLTLLPGLFGWYQGWLNEKRSAGSIIPSWLLHGCMNFLTGVLSL